MLQINFMKRKARSKKGFTLVEVITAIMVFAIVTVGILNAVAFSREMIYSNNSRDKASEKAQLVADEIVSIATGVEPTGSTKADIVAAVKKVTNAPDSSTANNVQAEAIGEASMVSEFTTPGPEGVTMIQYKIEPLEVEDAFETTRVVRKDDSGRDVEAQKIETQSKGWKIQVRAYYKNIGGSDEYRCVDINAFAPYNIIS